MSNLIKFEFDFGREPTDAELDAIESAPVSVDTDDVPPFPRIGRCSEQYDCERVYRWYERALERRDERERLERDSGVRLIAARDIAANE